MDSVEFSPQRDSRFNDLLNKLEHESYQLPVLENDFLNRLKELKDWLWSFFPELPSFPNVQKYGLNSLKVISVIMVVLLFVLLIFLIYKYLKSKTYISSATTEFGNTPQKNKIEELLREGLFREAITVIWKSHLLSKRLDSGLTPLEYGHVKKIDANFEFQAWSNSFYEAMYFHSQIDEKQFKELKNGIDRLGESSA